MREVGTVPAEMYDCPLLKRQITDEYCCDVNFYVESGENGTVLEKADFEAIDRDTDFDVCEKCGKIMNDMFMAIIYPKYNKERRPKIFFRVSVVQVGEGAIPHVHVYYGNIKNKNTPTAYIRLDRAKYYAPYQKNRKLLNDIGKKELIEFFNTFRDGGYALDKNNNPIPCNCWRECVNVWINTYSDELFSRDVDGDIVMPDYSKLDIV